MTFLTSHGWFKAELLNLKWTLYLCKLVMFKMYLLTARHLHRRENSKVTWNDTEGYATLLSFWDFYLFESICLFMYYWFTNGLKPRHFSDTVTDCIWNCQESERNKTKQNKISGQFFWFSTFSGIWKLEIDFCVNFNKYLW